MAKVRVKIPTEPKVVELPAHLVNAVTPSQAPLPPVNQLPPVEPTQIKPVEAPLPPPTAYVPPLVRKRPTLGHPSVLIGITVIVVAVFFGGVAMSRNSGDSPKQTLGASTTGATTDEQLGQQVAQIVELPAGQTPRIVTISDADTVKKENSALGDIKNGDKMLFYTQTRKVVVYRPDTKKVIAVVSLSPQEQSTN